MSPTASDNMKASLGEAGSHLRQAAGHAGEAIKGAASAAGDEMRLGKAQMKSELADGALSGIAALEQAGAASREQMDALMDKGRDLIDSASEIQEAWFEGVETVLITAGASAPEDVVQECIALIRDRYGASLTEEVIREEDVTFPLPKTLRELLPSSALKVIR